MMTEKTNRVIIADDGVMSIQNSSTLCKAERPDVVCCVLHRVTQTVTQWQLPLHYAKSLPIQYTSLFTKRIAVNEIIN